MAGNRLGSKLASIVWTLCIISVLFTRAAIAADDRPILIISSYNPDSYSTATNISEFIEEYTRLGGNATVHIENMNCRSFSESLRWKLRMQNILEKYSGDARPACIILLGQEAWASYLSQDPATTTGIPVFSAMASRNAVILPDGNEPIDQWMPPSIDFVSEPSVTHIQGGFLYEYDVESNIRLIRTLYPETRNIAFVSDNTYGGVAIQAFIRREMQEKFPDMTLQLLDGRTHTIYTIVEALRELPPNSALLLGTWRVDQNDGYFMQNATYSMMEAASDVPTFSLTSLGLGYWAIAGYIPQYRNFGKDVAQQVFAVLSGQASARNPIIVPNGLNVDKIKLDALRIPRSRLPETLTFLNVEPTFYQQYRLQIWTLVAIFSVLSLALALTLLAFARTQRMKNSLLASQNELRTAKEKAEESNRLKSAFLANMSHEIRTPLNAIVGFSNILATMEPSPKSRQTCAENIKNSSSLLLRLINDILDVSKLEAERMVFTWRPCDIVVLLRQTLQTVEFSAHNNNQLIFNPPSPSFTLVTDEQRLQQVIINLLSNAGKFTRDGAITLAFEHDEARRRILFSVEDTGTGIPADKRETVFGRFEKLDSFAQGTGLGLSICRLTTAKWGGEIWIDPDYTVGTRFLFTHPTTITPSPEA